MKGWIRVRNVAIRFVPCVLGAAAGGLGHLAARGLGWSVAVVAVVYMLGVMRGMLFD